MKSKSNNKDEKMGGEVGRRLKFWRKSSNRTLKHISQLIGISQSALSELENGKSLPSATTLASLCLKSELSVCWLLTGSEEFLKGKVNQDAEQLVRENIEIYKSEKMEKLTDKFRRIYQLSDPNTRAQLEGFLMGIDSEI